MIRLKDLRKAINKSQQAVANAVGTSQRNYAYYESGTRVADYQMLISLADYFNVSLDYLLGRETPKLSEERQQILDAVPTLNDEQIHVLLIVVNSFNK